MHIGKGIIYNEKMKMDGVPELCDVDPHNDFDYKATNKKLLKFSRHCIEINFLTVSN